MAVLEKREILERVESERLLEEHLDLSIQVQPAGVDLTLRKVYRFKGPGRIDFDNSERALPELEELEFGEDGWIYLERGAYLIQYNEVVSVPLDLIAIGRPRSSLLRAGAAVFSAIWDPGYRGRGVSLLVVFNERGIYLKKNCRILQLVFLRLSKPVREGYRGAYLGEGLSRGN